MSNNDLITHIDDGAVRSATPQTSRSRWAWVMAGLVAVVLLIVLAGCSSDGSGPAVPTSVGPPSGTTPAAGVPLEPGSNLPPGDGEGDGDGDDTITTSTG